MRGREGITHGCAQSWFFEKATQVIISDVPLEGEQAPAFPLRAMKDLAREARQVRCSGTEKGEAWEGCQGGGILKAVVRTLIFAAAAAQMDQGRATDQLCRSSRRGIARSKTQNISVWAGAFVLAWLDVPFCRDVT